MNDIKKADTLAEIVECLENDKLADEKIKTHCYVSLQQHLTKIGSTDNDTYEKVLKICVRDLEKDIKYSANIINVIKCILMKLEEGYKPDTEIYTKSAVSIINKINMTSEMQSMENLRDMCINTLLLFPHKTLESVVISKKADVIDLFTLHNYTQLQPKFRILIFEFLYQLLTTLPSEVNLSFIKSMTPVLFSKVIPSIVNDISNTTKEIESKSWTPLDLLEVITKELVETDYSENQEWITFLGSISDSQKYPLIIKNLLTNKSTNWHRLWIIFCKLLKDQKSCTSTGIVKPINSLLSIVELAFKLDARNRSRGFHCWTVFTNVFYNLTDNGLLEKRLSLLMVPLKANNAKVEETTVAKFDAWWHLIVKFETKLLKKDLVESVLISFLHFCFGKYLSEKSLDPSAQHSDHIKQLSVSALVEIVGHTNCSGCVQIPRLKKNLLNKYSLADFWMDWTYSLEVALNFSLSKIDDQVPQNVLCLMQSFLMTTNSLQVDVLKADILNDLLAMLSKFVQNCSNNYYYAETVFSLLLSFFREGYCIVDLTSENDALTKIIKLALDPSLHIFYERCDKKDMVKKFQPLTDYVLRKSEWLSYMMNILSLHPENDSTLTLWTSLAESVRNQEVDSNIEFSDMMLWPLIRMNKFDDVKYPAMVWYATYTKLHTKLIISDFEKKAWRILNDSIVLGDSSIYFTLCVTLAILRNGLVNHSTKNYESYIRLLETPLKFISHYQDIEEIFPKLIDTFSLVTEYYISSKNTELTKIILTCIKNFMKLVEPVLKENSNIILVPNMEILWKTINILFKTESNPALNHLMSDVIVTFSPYFSKLKLENNNTSSHSPQNIACSDINELPKTCNKNNEEPKAQQTVTNGKFTTLNNKEISKSTKKKEALVINTVSVNGEEFVVVKSNWKFNPKMLTENQKEKLQRKREDIPALYQDLSQSRDDFSLIAMTTDSQDTTTSSKSNSESIIQIKDALSVLKNTPGTEIVPKITENNLAEKEKNKNITIEDQANKICSKSKKEIANSNSKKQRMAFQDRVLNNVKNLIENSKVEDISRDMNISANQIENIPRTPPPVKVTKNLNLVKSAPPLPHSERPSRVKRIPKKFMDTEIFESQKVRCSQNGSQSDEEVFNNKTLKVSLERIGQINTKVVNKIVDEFENDICAKNIVEARVENTDSLPVIHVDNTVEKNDSIQNSIFTTSDLYKKCTISESQPKKAENILSISNTGSFQQKSTYCHNNTQISPVKSTRKRKSRIENQLSINMVEGHPCLNTPLMSQKRSTRNKIKSAESIPKKRRLTNQLNKSPTELSSKYGKQKKILNKESVCVTVTEKQEESNKLPYNHTPAMDIFSEDIIESSQDSTTTTVTVTRKTPKKKLIIPVKNVLQNPKYKQNITETQSLVQKYPEFTPITPVKVTEPCDDKTDGDILDNTVKNIDCQSALSNSVLVNQENKDDTELPPNLTVDQNINETACTENMDTQNICDNDLSDIDAENTLVTVIGGDKSNNTQEIAEAATQEVDPIKFSHVEMNTNNNASPSKHFKSNLDNDTLDSTNISETDIDRNDIQSSLKDDAQRQKDFINDTINISPIKTLSPNKVTVIPSDPCDADVVIQLDTPVQSNGEPFEKDLLAFHSEDHISPDKRNCSPPRTGININTTSPSTSLSLNKNKPLVSLRSRGAQMLSLCVHDNVNSDNGDKGEAKKVIIPLKLARRKLQILNSSAINNNDVSADNGDDGMFLKLNRLLPTNDSSPSGPILKRKFNETTDDASSTHGTLTASSPQSANKKKRVSFHDPPVSTKVSVQKYIEPSYSRIEKQLSYSRPTMKSRRRLDEMTLNFALTRAVECFGNNDLPASNDDTQMTSPELTPVADVVKTSELNNTDPICADLLHCKDPIENIASELSSASMKSLLIKELAGKIETIGDLARMTEVDINRLCIKAPKVKVAKKALNDYYIKLVSNEKVKKLDKEVAIIVENLVDNNMKIVNTKMQTDDVRCNNVEVQTTALSLSATSTQTDSISNSTVSIQTDESGCKSTAEIIRTCIAEREDFLKELTNQLDESSIQKTVEKLPFSTIIESLMEKTNKNNVSEVLTSILEHESIQQSLDERRETNELLFISNYLCNRFDTKDLILFSSRLLQEISKKST